MLHLLLYSLSQDVEVLGCPAFKATLQDEKVSPHRYVELDHDVVLLVLNDPDLTFQVLANVAAHGKAHDLFLRALCRDHVSLDGLERIDVIQQAIDLLWSEVLSLERDDT